METANLYEALAEMRTTTTPFTVTFVTYSKERQTGGEVVTMKNVLVGGQQQNEYKNFMISFRQADSSELVQRRCYIHAIQYFNGKKILW